MVSNYDPKCAKLQQKPHITSFLACDSKQIPPDRNIGIVI